MNFDGLEKVKTRTIMLGEKSIGTKQETSFSWLFTRTTIFTAAHGDSAGGDAV
jgi:hypothetical protein